MRATGTLHYTQAGGWVHRRPTGTDARAVRRQAPGGGAAARARRAAPQRRGGRDGGRLRRGGRAPGSALRRGLQLGRRGAPQPKAHQRRL